MNCELKVFSYYKLIDPINGINTIVKYMGTKILKENKLSVHTFLPLNEKKNFYIAESVIKQFSITFEEANEETIKVLYGRS